MIYISYRSAVLELIPLEFNVLQPISSIMYELSWHRIDSSPTKQFGYPVLHTFLHNQSYPIQRIIGIAFGILESVQRKLLHQLYRYHMVQISLFICVLSLGLEVSIQGLKQIIKGLQQEKGQVNVVALYRKLTRACIALLVVSQMNSLSVLMKFLHDMEEEVGQRKGCTTTPRWKTSQKF